jgi:hypothetical protein
MTRRVLFLGAGASVGAGYPLGRDLIHTVEDYFAKTELDVGRKAHWGHFLARRETAHDREKLLLTSGNPEVVLSCLDLCAEALTTDDGAIRAVERDAVHEFKNIPNGDEATAFAAARGEYIETLYDDPKRQPLKSAIRAQLGFVSGLDAYLEHMHWRDDQQEASASREYLHREIASLTDGDVIITTNYDTLAERVLFERGMWSAADGYGFAVPLTNIPRDVPRPRRAPPAWATPPSRVKVLKLHGSFGWRLIEDVSESRSDHIILGSEFLSAMLPTRRGQLYLLYDRREQDAPFPMTVPALAYPSFLKQVVGSTFLEIWEAARLALAGADEIRILGASLPLADAAVRTLFGPARFRLARGEVSIQIDDKSEESFDRWASHLGQDVCWIRRFAGE